MHVCHLSLFYRIKLRRLQLIFRHTWICKQWRSRVRSVCPIYFLRDHSRDKLISFSTWNVILDPRNTRNSTWDSILELFENQVSRHEDRDERDCQRWEANLLVHTTVPSLVYATGTTSHIADVNVYFTSLASSSRPEGQILMYLFSTILLVTSSYWILWEITRLWLLLVRRDLEKQPSSHR